MPNFLRVFLEYCFVLGFLRFCFGYFFLTLEVLSPQCRTSSESFSSTFSSSVSSDFVLGIFFLALVIFASNLVSQYRFAPLFRLEPSCLKSLLRTIDESYQICKNFFDGVFSFPCIFVRKSLQKLSYSSDSFSLESPAALCRASFLGAVYEDEKKSGAQSALDPNVGEINALGNVKLHDDKADPLAAAAGDDYVVAGG